MKQADVRVGEQYRCYVSGVLSKVEVVERTFVMNHGRRRKTMTRFIVRRVDNGRTLPVARTAAALRK